MYTMLKIKRFWKKDLQIMTKSFYNKIILIILAQNAKELRERGRVAF